MTQNDSDELMFSQFTKIYNNENIQVLLQLPGYVWSIVYNCV